MPVRPIYWCPVQRWYTRTLCRDRKLYLGAHVDDQLSDDLSLIDLDSRDVDGYMYREMWDAGLIPPLSGRRRRSPR